MAARSVFTTADEHHDDKQHDHDEGEIPNTFTQRGVPVGDPRSGPTPVSSPVSG